MMYAVTYGQFLSRNRHQHQLRNNRVFFDVTIVQSQSIEIDSYKFRTYTEKQVVPSTTMHTFLVSRTKGNTSNSDYNAANYDGHRCQSWMTYRSEIFEFNDLNTMNTERNQQKTNIT
jgi:hypothetical protein